MDLKVRKVGQEEDIVSIDLAGRMDYHFVLGIEKEIHEVIDNSHYKIILNMAGLEYISSSGLSLLLTILKEVQKNNGGLKLVKMQAGVMKILEVAELCDLFDIFDDENAAIESFNSRKGRMKLQLALDIGSEKEVLHLAEETSEYIDCIECGTPLIKNLGMQIVTKMRHKFPDKLIFADLKIMDVGEYEAGCGFDAGADIVSVCAGADNSTIIGTCKAAQKYQKKALVDLIGVKDKVSRVKEVEPLGVDIICVHVGIDEQMQGKDPLEIFKAVSNITNLPLEVAGGINLERLTQLLPFSPEFVVVGGAITHASNPREIAKTLKEKMEGKLP